MLDQDQKHIFIGLNSFVFVILVLMCLMIGALLRRYNNKMWWLPESAASMLLGIFIGLIIRLSSRQEALFIKFNPEIFFFVLLPPIILDAGYTLNKRQFFVNLGTILLYAVLGTILTTLCFGYSLYALSWIGLTPLETALECLLFGSIISATDAVATLAVMNAKHVIEPAKQTIQQSNYTMLNSISTDRHNNKNNTSTNDIVITNTNTQYAQADSLLYSLVFGESVLNDAVAIVLYQTFLSYIPNIDPSDGNVDFTMSFSGLISILMSFTGVTIVSLFIGVGTALACCILFKRVGLSTVLQLDGTAESTAHIEFMIIGLFSYLSYFTAEILDYSGIMSLFFCAVVLSHYNYYNISDRAKITTQEAFKGLAHISETFVFVYIGITAGLAITSATGSNLPWSYGLLLSTLVVGILSRIVNIIPLSAVANVVRHEPVTWRMQLMLLFCQLRGAISFSLSLNYPGKHRGIVVTSTLVMVIITTCVGGGMTLPLLKFTGNLQPVDSNAKPIYKDDTTDNQPPTTDTNVDTTTTIHSNGSIDWRLHASNAGTAIRDYRAKQMSAFATLLNNVDKAYMKPLFGGRQSSHTEDNGRYTDDDEHESIALTRVTSHSSLTSHDHHTSTAYSQMFTPITSPSINSAHTPNNNNNNRTATSS